MNKKTVYYAAGGGLLLLVLLWLFNRNKVTPPQVSNAGPGYMTYNQPIPGVATIPVAGGNLTRPNAGGSCGCDPNVSAAMAQGYDMAARLADKLHGQLNDYAGTINEYLSGQGV